MGPVPLRHVSWYRPLALLGLVLLFSCPVGIVWSQSGESEREDEGGNAAQLEIQNDGRPSVLDGRCPRFWLAGYSEMQ